MFSWEEKDVLRKLEEMEERNRNMKKEREKGVTSIQSKSLA